MIHEDEVSQSWALGQWQSTTGLRLESGGRQREVERGRGKKVKFWKRKETWRALEGRDEKKGGGAGRENRKQAQHSSIS